MEFLGHKGYYTHTYIYMNILFTFFAMIFVLLRELLNLKLLKIRGVVEMKATLCSAGRFKWLLFEWAILLIQPYPIFIGVKHYTYNELVGHVIHYHVNEYLQLISLARYFYLVPALLNFTRWRSSSADRIW
jgi:hypothetical protein